MASKTLYILDLYSFIFRAYYAIRPLNAPDGTIVNAVYGVATMLNKLIAEKKPDHLVVCADSKEKGFREEIYPQYKANRAEVPEDLIPQFALIDELVRTLGIPVLREPGFEADDLIATLVKKFNSRDHTAICIVSSDKDLMQLVSDKKEVFLYDTMKDKIIREREVMEKFGVPPDKVLEVQGLCGDSSDNIPGISGVGPKTAAKLINDYGSVENVLKHASQIKGKLGEKILEEKNNALISLELVTLKDDVPLKIHWEDLAYHEVDLQKIKPFYERMNFRTLLHRDAGATKTTAIPAGGKKFGFKVHVLDSAEKIRNTLEHYIKLSPLPPLAFDTETDDLDTQRAGLVGISLCFSPSESFYIPITHKSGTNVALADVVDPLAPVLANPQVPKIAQNAKFDMNMLGRHDMPVHGLVDDTLIASYLTDPDASHNLDVLAKKYLDHDTIKFDELVKRGKTFRDVPVDEAARYSAEDAWVVFMIREAVIAELKKQELEKIYREIEMPLIPVLSQMERNGILVDQNLLQELKIDFEQRLKKLEKEIHQLAGTEFNINSPKQLAEILFVKLGLPTQRKTKTGFSTDVDVLEALAPQHELPKKLLDYRMLGKLISTYVDQLRKLINPQTGRIHTTFNQAIAATGRLSSADPNLQNIPIKTPEGRRIREVFIAAPGHVIFSADYSQIELRLLAAFSQDPQLVEAYRKNIDIHKKTAASLFGMEINDVTNEMRATAKTVNFGVLYGQSPYGLSQQLGVPQKDAKRFIDSFYENFSRVRDYREEVINQARHQGYVATYLGRRRHVPDINSQNMMKRQNAERVAFNTVFQGSAADLIKKAMIEIDRQIEKQKLKSKMLLQVHDELVFEVPLEELHTIESLVPPLMENALELPVPLKVSFSHGKHWGEAH